MTRVIICGGRKFRDWEFLKQTLDALHEEHQFTLIMHGAAPGADTLAGTWAATHSLKVKSYPALWATYGRSAGMIRNKVMIDQSPDLVVAFPGGRGTEGMVALARQRKVKVISL